MMDWATVVGALLMIGAGILSASIGWKVGEITRHRKGEK